MPHVAIQKRCSADACRGSNWGGTGATVLCVYTCHKRIGRSTAVSIPQPQVFHSEKTPTIYISRCRYFLSFGQGDKNMRRKRKQLVSQKPVLLCSYIMRVAASSKRKLTFAQSSFWEGKIRHTHTSERERAPSHKTDLNRHLLGAGHQTSPSIQSTNPKAYVVLIKQASALKQRYTTQEQHPFFVEDHRTGLQSILLAALPHSASN